MLSRFKVAPVQLGRPEPRFGIIFCSSARPPSHILHTLRTAMGRHRLRNRLQTHGSGLGNRESCCGIRFANLFLCLQVLPKKRKGVRHVG